jgi:(+)-abscisic acid 8'-hydroxylase
MAAVMTLVSLGELGLMAACAWPLLKLAWNPRLSRMAPRAHAALGIALAAAAALTVLVGARAPALLHPLAVGTGIVAAAAAWRARPGLGRSRHLAPGSLSLTQSIAAIVDRDYYAKQFDRHGPVFKMAQFNEKVVCVLGHARWHDLLRAHGHALGPSLQRINDDVHGGFLRYMDDDRHRVYGRLFRAALGPSVVAAADPVVRRAARQELARAAAASASAGPVRPDDCLEAIVLAAFGCVLAGIDPVRDGHDARAVESAHATLRHEELGRRLSPAGRSAFDDLGALFRRRARALHAAGASGHRPVCAISELARLDPAMPDDTCVDNLVMILKIGSSNVLGLLRWLVKMVGDQPEWLDRLRADLGGSNGTATGPRLVDRLVMETLRLEQSEYLYRRIQTRFRHEGVEFPAGWQVRLCVRESHRRGDIFEAPHRFDPDRFLTRAYTKAEYSPFGTGSHACNGVDLTHMVCRVALEELAREFDLAIAQDGPPERDFRHWSHWRPSSRLRVRVAPRISPPASGPGPRRSGPSGNA